jgi:uncharacterized protein (DUF1800 family)
MKAVMQDLFASPQFWDSTFQRYSWPVEFVARAIKDIGWVGFSVGDAVTPLSNMGQNLFEPPDVAGWEAGQAWFSTGAMLARMNFAASLAANQRFNLAKLAKDYSRTPETMLAYFAEELRTPAMDPGIRGELVGYLRANGAWTASDAQLQAKSAGLVHLIAGSPEYQLV